jgi:urease accessory protein UreE
MVSSDIAITWIAIKRRTFCYLHRVALAIGNRHVVG